ncbi:MAG: CO dehydrogenase/CO-methylating acetyl-CoA synthase complex subunit beta [Methanomassiliicoccales archaeon]|nr:CO dehydrogenase/CO-methylating acetyl-CoA synthase complex subunit beta [Methanomassiliicoccales archaeon]
MTEDPVDSCAISTKDIVRDLRSARKGRLALLERNPGHGVVGDIVRRIGDLLWTEDLWSVDLSLCLELTSRDLSKAAGLEPWAPRESRDWERFGLLAPLEDIPDEEAYLLILALRESLAWAMLGRCLMAVQEVPEQEHLPSDSGHEMAEGLIRGVVWQGEGERWSLSGTDGRPPLMEGGREDTYLALGRLRRELSRKWGAPFSHLPVGARTADLALALEQVLMGFPVLYLGKHMDDPAREFFAHTCRDLFGGVLHFDQASFSREMERRRWMCGLPHRYAPPAPAQVSNAQVIALGFHGAELLLALARVGVLSALRRRGNVPVEYPGTAYGLPCALGWNGIEVTDTEELLELVNGHSRLPSGRGLEDALEAGRRALLATEVLEALRYLDGDPHAGTATVGFVPDRVLRELGLAFVDDTIPGAAVLMGAPQDGRQLLDTVRQLQARGMLIMAVDEVVEVLREKEVQMGLGMMLYPLGDFTQLVHALDFIVRAALSFGGVQKGDAERLSAYLAKRPKAFVLHFGHLDACRAAMALAALTHHVPIVTDQLVEGVPDLLFHKGPEDMLQGGLEARDIRVAMTEVDVPVPFGPAFEGETVRRPDTYLEAGGGRTASFELLMCRPEDQVRDGEVRVIGADVDSMPEGSQSPMAILVDVFGKRMQRDFESVMERRIHLYLNYAEGLWHTGQRNLNWVRLSKKAFRAGLRLRHLGNILVTKLKEEFGNIVSRVQVTIVTDQQELERRLPEALTAYREREERMAGLTDESVDTFYSCLMCQSFAPDHVCVITPERPGLCGAINWLDARTGREIVPSGPNQPIPKGEVEDASKGSWEGVNDAVASLTHGKIARFCAYSMMEDPMTSCGCFECIVAMSPDMQSVIVVNREFPDITPVGMRFTTLAGNIGGGRQTPGFIGVGRRYLVSKKFISADGGFLRISWMPSSLKEDMREELINRARELGVPDFLEKVADETKVTDAEGLMRWMLEVDHPALRMPPLL